MKSDLMPDLDELEAIGSSIDDVITDTKSVDCVVIDNQDKNNITEKIYYYDALGNACDKENAVQYCVVRYDKYGNELSQNWNRVNGSFQNNFGGRARTVAGDIGKRVNDNDFIKSVKSDIRKSDTIKTIKNKVGNVANSNANAKVKSQPDNKKIRLMAIVLVFAIVIISITCNIHKCFDCEEMFFGKGHKITTYWGEEVRICNDCYGFD